MPALSAYQLIFGHVKPQSAKTLERSYQCVKKGGLLITTAGMANSEKAKELGIEIEQFLMKPKSKDLEKVADLVANGKIKPRPLEAMPLKKAAEALPPKWRLFANLKP